MAFAQEILFLRSNWSICLSSSVKSSNSCWQLNFTSWDSKKCEGFSRNFYNFWSSARGNAKSRVSMLISRTPRAHTSIFEKSSIIGYRFSSNCSGAINYLVPDKNPLRISGPFWNASWSSGVEYEKSMTLASAKSSESIMFHGLRSLWQ